jgi:hypothetical protein
MFISWVNLLLKVVRIWLEVGNKEGDASDEQDDGINQDNESENVSDRDQK